MNPDANNIGIGIRANEAGQVVGGLTSDQGWLSFQEGSKASQALARIPGFNSGAVFHDALVGGIERSIGMHKWGSTAQIVGGLFTNQATIVPAIAINYYSTGIGSYYDSYENITGN